MSAHLSSFRKYAAFFSLVGAALAVQVAFGQQTPAQFGGAYAGLDARRQRFVDNWVARLAEVTGQKVEAGPFYDDIVSFSAKTTFDAVTHALMTTPLTDASGARMGDALSLVERVEAVRGEVTGASSDRQFRMYVRLVEGALDTLARSKEFKRGVDNAIFHVGYPINYRQQGGIPSIQISVARDGRRADIDVDYRLAFFPISMVNGHLSASNSDVRAGRNSDRHTSRWTGLESWWRSFFGIRTDRSPEALANDKTFVVPKTPRAGTKNIDVMVHDFLTAWLVEGNVAAAMGYISERSYACIAQDRDDPTDFDRGMAPFQLMINLRAAHDALGSRSSLDGLVVGVRLTTPGLRVVRQPHHAQFVIYSVPDDIAADVDCESRLTPGDSRRTPRAYGNYFGATFYVDGRKDHRVSLLWGRENGYWKIVSWRAGEDETDPPLPDAAPVVKAVRIPADPGFAQAARSFLDAWLVRRDYDAAFRFLSTKSYGCYDLERSPDQPASTSPDNAGRRIRAGIERVGQEMGKGRSLDAMLVAVEPVHESIRVMDHANARTFSLTSVPNALGDALECEARVRGSQVPDPLPLEYGDAFGMTVRFRTKSGEAPVLRLLWRREGGAWRITSYGIELP